ncbi:MAG: sigma-70 family RNA polymerase sigma factor [Phycisphaerae bacterium]|nr:sigma-70 family RNA polymerase sigma factor [Phycisphaerae bacterium]
MAEVMADNRVAGAKGDGRFEPIEDSQARMLADLYERHYEPIFRYCVHRLFDRTLAEDVVGAVFLDAARTIRNFRGSEEDEYRRWLYAIATNHIATHIRTSLRRRVLLQQAAEAGRLGPHDEPARTDGPEWPQVWRAIQTLGRNEQTILTLRFFENLDFASISAIVGKRETAVRTMLCRSLKKLRTQLKSVFDGDR